MEYQNSSIDLEYCRASSGKRLANYLIDLVAFYCVLFFVGMVVEIIFPGSVSQLENIDPILDRLVTLVVYGFVMFLIEAAFQGKSLGKLITGTKAVSSNGATLTFGQFILRNFIRAVPFNALSALGSPSKPWHDSWSHSIVIDEKVLALQEQRTDFFDELKSQTQ